MKRTITIDPVSRISGFLDITTEVENNVVTNAKTSGLLFRGFEKMLKGRFPLDAIYFTERICGICSTSHAIASSLALENALKLNVSLNDLYIRDLIHGFEFLQNHLRHFYFFMIPDYIKLPDLSPLSPQPYTDYRLPSSLTEKINEHYLQNITLSRLAHEALAVLGGKAPHNHGIFPGGVTINIDAYKLQKLRSILDSIQDFVDHAMVEDMNSISHYYNEYFEIGTSYSNFMSFGFFDAYSDSDITFVKPSVMIRGVKYPLEPNEITENIRHAWYTGDQTLEKPWMETIDDLDLKKADAYSFIKAPRYNGIPMEGGPLARMMLTGEYTRGTSCMDRNVARVLETQKIIRIMQNLLNRIELTINNQKAIALPDAAFGVGLTDTIRGTLGHWMQIENKVIKYYNIITPTGWNLSPIDSNGIHGPAENALIGTKLTLPNSSPELGRIIRSFDPCISCATH